MPALLPAQERVAGMLLAELSLPIGDVCMGCVVASELCVLRR